MSSSNANNGSLPPPNSTNIKSYKATLILTVVYSLITIGLLILLFTQLGGYISKQYFAFTLTLVIGMLTVVMVLIAQLASSKPKKKKSLQQQGTYKCPDYYRMVPSSNVDLTNLPSGVQKGLFSYYCEPDPSIINISSPATSNLYIPWALSDVWDNTSGTWTSNGNPLPANASPPVDNTGAVIGGGLVIGKNNSSFKYAANFLDQQSGFFNYQSAGNSNLFVKEGDGLIGGASNLQLSCSRIFPDYVESKEVSNNGITNTDIRCNISRLCGVPWTGMCY